MATAAAASMIIRHRRVQQHSAAAGRHQPAEKSSVVEHHRDRERYNRQKKKRFSLRDQFIRTNLDIYLLGAFFAIINGWILHLRVVEATTVEKLSNITDNGLDAAVLEGDVNLWKMEVFAIFFPVFCQSMAILIYFLLSRYLTFVPYTAVVFLMGVGIGYKSVFGTTNAILFSSLKWTYINGQVVLLIFLPGLIFLDAFTINVHLFFQAFWQLMIFAFPMVLVGAGLTAAVAKYVFPYGWDWNLCMTFGAILSATDPVAVAGLFNALGAPPRMQMHISGESLLNDGSSVLLFNIFSQRFFYGMNVGNFGKDIGWGEGFEMFFRLTFGGALIGLAFGLGTVFMLKFLNRRLSHEENVVQVVLTVAVAYMAYFVAEILCQCSGIISTITCGLTVKVLGITLVHDVSLMLNFWRVLGELLNTLLFVLGGTLWGNIISPSAGFFVSNVAGWSDRFEEIDWGYLIVLWLMLMIIRFIIVFGFYPIISRIGIGASWKEAIFMSFGGFRGTVGIALALSLSSQVTSSICDIEKIKSGFCETNVNYRNQANTLFCFVGGISILTLMVNGLFAGPLLKLLKLSKSEKTRQKVVENYWKNMIEHVLVDYVRLLSQERFQDVDFSIVREHVPFIGGITYAELMSAVDVHKRNTPPYLYSTPNLAHVVPYILQTMQQRRKRSVFIENGYNLDAFGTNNIGTQPPPSATAAVSNEQSLQSRGSTKNSGQTTQQRRQSQAKCFMQCDKDIFDPEVVDESIRDIVMDEERLNFIEILRKCYYEQLSNGELDISGDLQYSLFQGLDFCEESASKGQPLNDWNATKVASATNVVISNRFFIIALIQMKLVLQQWMQACKEMWIFRKKCCSGTCDKMSFRQRLKTNSELFVLSKVSFSVRQSLAFQNAHRQAQKIFAEEFASYPLSPADEKVIRESETQVLLAEADLEGIDTDDVNLIKGHLLCRILVNKAVDYVETLSRQGLIPDKDGNEMLELLDGYKECILLCRRLIHEGMIDLAQQSKHLRRLPLHRREELNLGPLLKSLPKEVFVPDVDAVNEDSEMEEDFNLGDKTELETHSLFSSLNNSTSV